MDLEQRVPADHPLRARKALEARVLREWQRMEQLECNLLFPWLVCLGSDAPVWHPTVFTKNRDRLLAGDVTAASLAGVLRQSDTHRPLSHEHFTVDGTLLEAWASHKNVQPKTGAPRRPDDDDPGNPTVNFHGERRSNATHVSTTDPDSPLAKKGHG